MGSVVRGACLKKRGLGKNHTFNNISGCHNEISRFQEFENLKYQLRKCSLEQKKRKGDIPISGEYYAACFSWMPSDWLF